MAATTPVTTFKVPESLDGHLFVLTAQENGKFTLADTEQDIELTGSAGTTLKAAANEGEIELRIGSFSAQPGAQFLLRANSRLDSIKKLQTSMVIAEKGKQSGIIGISLEGEKPLLITNILNEIGLEYVRQNVERKAEEAQKSLSFLDKQLPDLKQQLEESENKFNQFRNVSSTIDLGEEGKNLLAQSVAIQTRLIELKQKRQELLIRFTKDHPSVVGLDSQAREINGEMQAITERIKKLPLVEQDVLRLTRDVKINTDLYTALLNSAQQLRLVKAGKVGNARLIDAATVPKRAVKPDRFTIVAIAVLLGLFLGVISAFVRKSLFGGISDAHEIEQQLGLTVYANIPHSKEQEALDKKIKNKTGGNYVLAQVNSQDTAIESLRSFRTALHFSMLDSKNNIVLITGPTPGMGKSFVSVNFAAVLALSGKKVLLVDADLRKGHLNQYFGLPRENGLSELVAGSCTLAQVLRKDVIENVDFISTGALPRNPSELLAHKNVASLLQDLSASYDYVLIDTPPVLAVSDTLSIGRCAGTTFMVARAGIATISQLKESVKLCNHNGIAVKGVVFNDIVWRPGNYNYGGYGGKYRYVQYKY